MKKSMFVSAIAVAACLLAAGADAATVSLTLELDPAVPGCNGCTMSGAGRYNLFAVASADDNFGIAGYGISLQNVTSVLHRAPRVNSSETPDGDIFPAGFTLLRSANNATALGTGFLIGAGQDTVTPTPYLIQGFGQTPGGWDLLLPAENTNGGIIQPTWSGKLLLAEGQYTPGGELPFVDFQNIDVFVNVIGEGGSVIRAGLDGGVDPNEPPTVGDLGPLVGDMSLNDAHVPTIVSGTLPAADDGGVENLGWAFDGAPTGPGAPVHAPTLDPLTGLFSWDVDGSMGGLYTFSILATDAGGLSDGGLLTVQVIVPEPATVCLVGLALVGFAGFRRK